MIGFLFLFSENYILNRKLIIMANFFNNTNSASVTAAGSVVMPPSAFSSKAPEVILQEKITAALEGGHWVVSLPWGGNPRPKQDGKESKHLLMTQKGPIAYGQYGVFADIRAEGFLMWMPEGDASGRPTRGNWVYPTSHRRGDDGDEPVPGAKLSGFHKLMVHTWKLKAQKVAEGYIDLAEEETISGNHPQAKVLRDKAKEVLDTANSYGIKEVFGKKFNFNIPMLTVPELKAMKVNGMAQAQAKLGGAKLEKATMTFNLILSIDFQYSEDGEFSIQVHDVIEQYAPLMTIPNGSRTAMTQLEVLQAMQLDEGSSISKAARLAALDTQAGIIASKGGKNADKKEARKAIRLMAAEMEVDIKALEAYITERAGRKGMAWGAANLKPTKEEVLNWAKEGNTSNPNESVQAGAEAQEETPVTPQGSLLPNHQSDTPDAADIDVEV